MIIRHLLADAELAEDVAEDFVGGNFTGDGAEVVEGFAEVLGYEVGRSAGGDAGAGEGEGAGGGLESVIMARVGHESGRPGIGDTGFLVVGKGLIESFEVITGFRGHYNNIYLIISERNNIVKISNNFVNT